MALEVPLALSIRQRVDDEVRSQARAQADVLAATVADLLKPSGGPELRRLVAESAASVRGRVLVVDAGGRLVADSAGTRLIGSAYGGRPEVAAALRGRTDQRARHSGTLGEDVLATAVPIRGGTRPPVGAVRITQSVAAVHRAIWRTILGLVLIGGVVLGVGLVAGLVIARTVARPMHELGEAARRVASGDLTARAKIEGSTEQRALARTFNEMTERVGRLVHSQQDFVADASHQLRTPLTGLRLRLEEARVEVGDAEERAAELDAAMGEVDRLAQILEELLVLSRAGERELPGEHVDLGVAAQRAAERWVAAAADRAQDIEAQTAGAGTVWCAPADLDRVLDVLVDNALRYSPEGSTVRVTAASDRIEVIDDGPGPAPGEEETVFERFHRGYAARNGPPGTGLGLPIARELASEWSATVSLDARQGGGARAVVRFAAASVAAQHQPALQVTT